MSTATVSTAKQPLSHTLNATFSTGVTRTFAWRSRQLRQLRRMIIENERVLEDCLRADLGKPAVESQVTEIGFVLAEIDFALAHLRKWMSPRRVAVPSSLLPARAKVVSEPLGAVLIIGPWNYPVQLTLATLVGAVAAGNAVALKPSELAPATSSTLARLIPSYLDAEAIVVVEGGPSETGHLLEQRWDHIFYTGNERVGRIVAEAAAKHLTPVTLELGGKSPTFVDSSTDMDAAARRIAWGKFVNAGQTCVAPDYVLVTPDARAPLETALARAVHRMFGENPAQSADYARIINASHFSRLTSLLQSSSSSASSGEDAPRPTVQIVSGLPDSATRFFPPTIVSGESGDSLLMQEEIFGPILPLIEVADHTAAIDFVTRRPKPLAIYVFSERRQVRDDFTEKTSSGALAFNIPLAHMGVHGLPFGGVGSSGYGAYHGKHSFDVFSHSKAVLSKPLKPETLSVIFPPYSTRKASVVTGALRRLS